MISTEIFPTKTPGPLSLFFVNLVAFVGQKSEKRKVKNINAIR